MSIWQSWGNEWLSKLICSFYFLPNGIYFRFELVRQKRMSSTFNSITFPWQMKKLVYNCKSWMQFISAWYALIACDVDWSNKWSCEWNEYKNVKLRICSMYCTPYKYIIMITYIGMNCQGVVFLILLSICRWRFQIHFLERKLMYFD